MSRSAPPAITLGCASLAVDVVDLPVCVVFSDADGEVRAATSAAIALLGAPPPGPGGFLKEPKAIPLD